MNEQNEALIRRWFEEVWNNKNETAIDEMLDDEVVGYGLNDGAGNEIVNKETFKQLFHALTGAYPDIRFHVDEVMSNDERAMARCTVTGTHTGEGLGIPATGKPIDFNGTLTLEFKDSKIIKAWNDFNFLKMYQQLDAIRMLAQPSPNETIIRRWFDEVWNDRRTETIDELLHEECVAYGLTDGLGQDVNNKEKFMSHFHAFSAAFPDVNVTVDETLADGDRVIARCTVRATHTGEGLGFPPTGRPVKISGMLLTKIKDGQIAEVWNEFNFMDMYQQLGVIGTNAPAESKDSAAANEAVMRRFFEEIWNQGREEVIDELFPDGVAHGLGDAPVRGAADYKPFYRALRSALPDVHVTVDEAICQGDMISVRCHATATHTGEGLGKSPTGNPVSFDFIAHARIADGKIAEAWNVVDFMTMHSQIDAQPAAI